MSGKQSEHWLCLPIRNSEEAYPDADLSDPNGDYDGDGVTNDDERLWGLDPTSGSSINAFSALFDASSGTFTYTRRNASPSEANYSYQ